MKTRLRRNRRTVSIRDAVAETDLSTRNLVYPIFVSEQLKSAQEISTMPGIFRHTLASALKEIEQVQKLNIPGVALFPAIPEAKKNSAASEALNAEGFAIEVIHEIKKRFPEIVLYTDVALDPFSSDGHDGLVKDGQILNDPTVEILAKMAVIQAQAGADYVSPSDMMDGRVAAIRSALDKAGHSQVGIMAYSAKFASNFYGPFRDALDSAPRAGDKKTYQMDYRNRREALAEIALDIKEGADIVMVKPALSYLDIIREARQQFRTPISAYNVSGEYAMLKFAEKAGCLNFEKAALEVLFSIRRAGADIVFTYTALQIAKLIK